MLTRCSNPVWSEALNLAREEMARRASTGRLSTVASWGTLTCVRCQGPGRNRVGVGGWSKKERPR